MRFIYFIIFLTVNVFSSGVVSQTIAIVDVQSLIDNNEIYIKTVKEIENNQEKYFEKFSKQEKNLEEMFLEIENSKLIDKYSNLAREALSNGDKILSENYFQHADHFMRILNERELQKKNSLATENSSNIHENISDTIKDKDKVEIKNN